MSTEAQIIAVGGGKGGVGKSSIAANLAVAFAGMGHRTVIVDLDLGGANLHTLFGIRVTDRGIGDYLFKPKSKDLATYALPTGIENLGLIPGNGFIPGIANIEHSKKAKIIRALGNLDADYILLDLGAGTSYNVIDFFSITRAGIVVTLPEPTAILNAYEFLKNVHFRMIQNAFKYRTNAANALKEYKITEKQDQGGSVAALLARLCEDDPEAAEELAAICADFKPALILNMNRGPHLPMARSIQDICRNYLSIEVAYLGAVTYDEAMRKSLLAMRPVLMSEPKAESARCLRAIAHKCENVQWLSSSAEEAILDEAAREDDAGEDGADQSQDEQPPPVPLSIDGRDEMELSSLVGNFFALSHSELKARTPAVKPVEPKPDQTEATRPEEADSSHEPADAKTPAESPDCTVFADELLDATPAGHIDFFDTLDNLKIGARINEEIRTPQFIAIGVDEEELEVEAPSRWALLFRKSIHREQSELIDLVNEILQVPMANNIKAYIRSLAQRAPAVDIVGRAWQQIGLQMVHSLHANEAPLAFAASLPVLTGDIAAQNNYAASLIAANKLIKPAQEPLHKICEQEPDEAAPYFNMGLVAYYEEHHAMAAEWFAAAREKEAQPLFAWFMQAYCLYLARDFHEAAAEFEAIARENPYVFETVFNSGLAQLQSGRYAQAINHFSAVLDLAPEDAEAYACRGWAHWNAENGEDALRDFTHAIDIELENLTFRTARGLISFKMGKFDIAIGDIQIITKLVPHNQEFQFLRAEIRKMIHGPEKPSNRRESSTFPPI